MQSLKFTIPEFVNHFSEHNSLRIPSGKPLCISGVRELNNLSLYTEIAKQDEDGINSQIHSTLAKIGAVIGSTFTLKAQPGTRCFVSLNDSYDASFTHPVEIIRGSGDVITDLPTLIYLMVICGKETLSFAPDQKLLLLNLEEVLTSDSTTVKDLKEA